MTYRVLCVALVASLFAGPTVAGAPRKPAKGDLDSTLARASSFCEGAALRPAGAGVELPSLRGIAIHDRAPRDAGVPDLVKRFARTRPMAPLASSPSLHLHFLAPGGDVWALVYDGLPACDVMVTGASGDLPAAASRLAEALGRDGWQIAGSSPATAAMPLAKHVLSKKIAKPGTPDFGLMLSLRALAGDSADPTGVQLEMRFLAGELRTSPGSSDVRVDMSLPAGKVGTSSPDPQ
jgi:hypothetical protein